MARDDVPSIREIAELTRRLRELSTAGRDADPAERAAFLDDKNALIARIQAATRSTGAAAGGRPVAAGVDGEPLDDARAALDDDGEEWSR